MDRAGHCTVVRPTSMIAFQLTSRNTTDDLLDRVHLASDTAPLPPGRLVERSARISFRLLQELVS